MNQAVVSHAGSIKGSKVKIYCTLAPCSNFICIYANFDKKGPHPSSSPKTFCSTPLLQKHNLPRSILESMCKGYCEHFREISKMFTKSDFITTQFLLMANFKFRATKCTCMHDNPRMPLLPTVRKSSFYLIFLLNILTTIVHHTSLGSPHSLRK